MISFKMNKKSTSSTIRYKYSINETSTKLTDNIYLAGDYMINGSLNVAMLSGRKAAEAIC